MDPQATLDAWRAHGAHRHDPVRFCFIEALARRAAVHGGEARRLLDARLAGLLADYADGLPPAGPATPALTAGHDSALPRSPLAALVQQLAGGRADLARRGGPAHPPELKTLSAFRSTWSRLSTERRLRQALAQVPGQAGPLNSHQLVHRSLALMQALSPAYLHRFMGYVDSLSWLDQANADRPPATASPAAPRPEPRRKTGRGRPG